MNASAPPKRLDDLPGIGPKTLPRLAKLGINLPFDLLLHLPSHYQDRTHITPIADALGPHPVLVSGRVISCQLLQRRGAMLRLTLEDGSGHMCLDFYHFSRHQQGFLQHSPRLLCFAQAQQRATGLAMVHPECQRLEADETPVLASHLSAIYPATQGLKQAHLRQWITYMLQQQPEHDPADALFPDLPSLYQALHQLHQPTPDAAVDSLLQRSHPAACRLISEELLTQQWALQQLRRQRRHADHHIPANPDALKPWYASLPFTLTTGQQQAIADIQQDLAKTEAMQRLVQGDVGCGKTAVAAAASILCQQHGLQTALLAPTEMLARQHQNSLQELLAPLDITVGLIVGQMGIRARKKLFAELNSGHIQLLVGTHALLRPDVCFQRLGLVIIDEQHRFGVLQRQALLDKAEHGSPHLLLLSATPIPRTLMMAWYSDLHSSSIKERPPGRQATTTAVLASDKLPLILDRLRALCQQGQQAFWVCPQVEDNEQSPGQSAEGRFQELSHALPELRCGLLHGQMKEADKQTAITAFRQHELDLLVATTVIEVGVDIPNASVIIIDNADRFGLAQLHQLRGRVGRGQQAGYCLLLYEAPISHIARQRLACLRDCDDGFTIAQRDLELRGAGELLGKRQSGERQFRLADLQRDHALLDPLQQHKAHDNRLIQHCTEQLSQRWLGDNITLLHA